MKTLTSAFIAASLLISAAPALADRDDRHHTNDFSRKIAQQHDRNDRQHDRREDRRQARREDRREDWREDRREARREDRRHERRDHHHGNDDHKFVKYVGYDHRYDKHRHGHGHGHGYRGHGHDHHPYRPVQLAHKHRYRPSHYGYGYRWTRLPRSYVSITFAGLGYYFSDGIFYRPYGPGYVVAQAPIGAFVQALPGTAVSVSYNGLNYFVAYDTYYRWDNHRHGYLVVANPGFI